MAGKRRKRAGRAAILPAIGILALVLILLVLWRTGKDRKTGTTRITAEGTVCVDAGHGGTDQGAFQDDRLEKDDNLRMALALQEALEERGITVVMTRTEDIGLELEERVQIANESGAELFLSIHRNSAEEDAYGTEVWVSEGCSETALELAQAIDQALTETGVQSSRGVREGAQSGKGNYYVLKHTAMPAVLIEFGFLQNEEDNRLFDQNLEAYAQAIADAVALQLNQGDHE